VPPGADEDDEQELVRAERETRDGEGAGALAEHGQLGGASTRAVPGVIAQSGDEKGDRGGGEVAQPTRAAPRGGGRGRDPTFARRPNMVKQFHGTDPRFRTTSLGREGELTPRLASRDGTFSSAWSTGCPPERSAGNCR